jgi:hypothetical protein
MIRILIPSNSMGLEKPAAFNRFTLTPKQWIEITHARAILLNAPVIRQNVSRKMARVTNTKRSQKII